MSDIVRYLPGVGISSDGRYGNNGYAIRGVDKDRVALVSYLAVFIHLEIMKKFKQWVLQEHMNM